MTLYVAGLSESDGLLAPSISETTFSGLTPRKVVGAAFKLHLVVQISGFSFSDFI